MMRSSVLAITVMLVYSAMSLPSTSALPPLKLAYNPNFYDQLHKIECPSGLGLYTVTTEHSNHHEDRIFTYTCRDVAPKATVSCYWTGYVNNYDDPVFFQCPANQYLGGTESRHDNGKEDRQFKFQCCSAGFTSKDCYLTGYQNNFDAKFTATAPTGQTFAGMHSYHSNHHE